MTFNAVMSKSKSRFDLNLLLYDFFISLSLLLLGCFMSIISAYDLMETNFGS